MYVGRGRTHPSCCIGASLQQSFYPIQRGVAKIKIPTLVCCKMNCYTRVLPTSYILFVQEIQTISYGFKTEFENRQVGDAKPVMMTKMLQSCGRIPHQEAMFLSQIITQYFSAILHVTLTTVSQKRVQFGWYEETFINCTNIQFDRSSLNAIPEVAYFTCCAYAITRVQVNQAGLKLNGRQQHLVYADGVNISGGSSHTVQKKHRSFSSCQ